MFTNEKSKEGFKYNINNTESDEMKEINHLFPVNGVRNDEAATEYWICSNDNNCGETSENLINTLFSYKKSWNIYLKNRKTSYTF